MLTSGEMSSIQNRPRRILSWEKEANQTGIHPNIYFGSFGYQDALGDTCNQRSSANSALLSSRDWLDLGSLGMKLFADKQIYFRQATLNDQNYMRTNGQPNYFVHLMLLATT